MSKAPTPYVDTLDEDPKFALRLEAAVTALDTANAHDAAAAMGVMGLRSARKTLDDEMPVGDPKMWKYKGMAGRAARLALYKDLLQVAVLEQKMVAAICDATAKADEIRSRVAPAEARTSAAATDWRAKVDARNKQLAERVYHERYTAVAKGLHGAPPPKLATTFFPAFSAAIPRPSIEPKASPSGPM